MVCGSGLWPLEAGCRRTSRKRAEYRKEECQEEGIGNKRPGKRTLERKHRITAHLIEDAANPIQSASLLQV